MTYSYKAFIVSIFCVSFLSCNNPEPETYLIPQGFIGRVNVIFNQKGGAKPKYENGRRIYEIPNDGILLTQCQEEYGLIDHRYYYIGANGEKTALKIYQYDHNKDGTVKWKINNPNEIGIFNDGTTGQYGNTGSANSAKWQEFIVSSFNALDSLESLDSFNKRISKLINVKL